MSQPTPFQIDVVRGHKPARTCPARSARYFYIAAAVVMLAVMLTGFYPYYLRGEGMGGRKISPQLLTLVLIHGAAMTAWVVLFLIQSLLIASRNRRLHMKLGWGAVAVALVVSVSGFMVAIQSVRPFPLLPFWGMDYRQFLMVMLAEVALFTLFVLAGVLSRKRPKVHRAMMLLASLSILAGATVRMPILFPIFGESRWVGIFGPIFTLGAVFLLVRSLLSRAFDRLFAVGYAAMIVVYVAASRFAVSDAWSYLAKAIFNT
ncbi:MAG: hypothetical protein ACR2LM_02940 [Pyrinomonadaceae bacterium]